MNTSHGNTVLPNNRRQAAAIAALKRACTLAVLIALGLTFGMARAAGVNPDQPIRLDGMELFFGIIPAEILRGHPREHEEQIMHGGVPRSRGQHHLIISLFDGKTRQRVAGATVTAKVGEIGLSVQEKKLEPMQFAGTMTYGNYFSMAAPGPYRIELEIRRASAAKPVKSTFEYSHPRR